MFGLRLPSWSDVTDFAGDVLGDVYDVTTEALDVPGAILSGRWSDVPGEIAESLGAAGGALGLVGGNGSLGAPEEYIEAMTGGGAPVAGASSTAHETVGGNGRLGGNGALSVGDNAVLEIDPKTGRLRKVRRRRRRRRLLTATDKADIAYLVGVLGTGQLGKAAVTAILSRRV